MEEGEATLEKIYIYIYITNKIYFWAKGAQIFFFFGLGDIVLVMVLVLDLKLYRLPPALG